MPKRFKYIMVGAGGSVDPISVSAQPGDTLVWLPEDEDMAIEVTFVDKSPVGRRTIPLLTAGGKIVRARVTTNPSTSTVFPYEITRTRRRAQPEIIIDPGPRLRSGTTAARRRTRKR